MPGLGTMRQGVSLTDGIAPHDKSPFRQGVERKFALARRWHVSCFTTYERHTSTYMPVTSGLDNGQASEM